MADRSRLPSPGAPRPFAFPAVEKSELPSGVRLWTAKHDAVPVVALLLLVRSGSAADPPGAPGLAAMTADMLDEGSGTRSAIEMHEALARIGAQFDTDVGADAIALSLSTLSRFTERGLALLGDIAARPALTEPDFDRVRQLRLHRLAQLRDVPGAVAERTFTRLLYGDHPYGHTSAGSEEALAKATIDDVRGFHQSELRADRATLIAVGDLSHAALERFAADAFAGWAGTRPDASRNIPPPPTPPRLNLVPRAGAPQSELRIGHIGVARSTPDYHAIVAMNMVLGGQFVSRVNMNLRQDKGFTYGARTSFDFRRMPGPFSLQVSVGSEVTGRALEESMRELAEIRGARPVTRDELELGVAALTRGYAKNFETAEQISRAMAQLALYDLPDDYFARFVPAIERVTTDDVARVAKACIDPDRLVTLIVGDAEAVRPQLEPLGLGEPSMLPADAF